MRQQDGEGMEDETWFTRAFGAHYLRVYDHRDEAAAHREIGALMEYLGMKPGGRVLDVCCGAGRHLAWLVGAGYEAFGVDLSGALLMEARRRKGLAGRLARGDIRALPYDGGVFDLAINLFTSFGYFAGDGENMAALRSMARVLKAGGRLVMDHANRRRVMETLETFSQVVKPGCVIEHHRRVEGGRVIKETTLHWDDDRRERYIESVRLYEETEIRAMFAAAGFSEVRLVGDFDGTAFAADSPRMIVIGERRA